MSASTPRRRAGLRLIVFVALAAAWTLFAMYPNPSVLIRNFARYRRLPIDPGLEQKRGWKLPEDPGTIELFVDSLLLSTPDWTLFRVPWYVPTALEAADMTHGDCEAKTLVLASLLEGKGIPYEIQASFSHIWVDYEGRAPRPGESGELAYLEGDAAKLSARWPAHVEWRAFLSTQREQLWTAMPLARKAIWVLGLIWVVLAVALVRGPPLRGDLASDWRMPIRAYCRKTAWLALLAFASIVAAFELGPAVRGPPWTLADIREVLALSALVGAFLAWSMGIRPRLAVTLDAGQMRRSWSLGLLRGSSDIDESELAQFELAQSRLTFAGWLISAALRSGKRVRLLRYGSEIAARAALRRLAAQASRPTVVRADATDYWTPADEIGLSLRQRAATRPQAAVFSLPRDLHLAVEESASGWAIGYPLREAGAVRTLLVMAGVAGGAGILATVVVARFPVNIGAWVLWCTSAVFLAMTIYAAISLREEILAWLGGSRVDVAEGQLRFRWADGRVESVPTDSIESVELSRQGEFPTIAVVAPERVIHVRLHCAPKEREWVRAAIERAVATLP